MADHEILVNDVDYTGNLVGYETIEHLNELGEWSATLADVTSSNTDIVIGKIVKFQLDGVTHFKGRIERVEYTTSTDIKIYGYDMGIKLVNRKMDRYSAENRNPTGTSPSIFTDIISENQDGTGADVMQIGTNTAYGAVISFRVEYDNRLRAVAGLANSLGWDWWVDQDGSDVDQINIDDFKGSASSVQTFNVFGASQNCSLSSREQDQQSVVNWITLLGYGDGINQLKTEFFAASPVFTYIDSNATTTATTITVEDTTGFQTAGYIKIGSELVNYTGTTGTTFTTCTRGVQDFGSGNVAGVVLTDGTKTWKTNQWRNYKLRISGVDYVILENDDTTITVEGSPPAGAQSYMIRDPVFEHYKGCAVFEYYDGSNTYLPSSPKAASSITTYGIHEQRIQKKEVFNLPTLELLATRLLIDRKDPLERIKIMPDEPDSFFTSITLGDTITLNDSSTGFSSTQYRVVGRRIAFDMSEYSEVLEYEVKNRRINYVDEMSDTKENTDTLSAYMDGAVNIYQVNETENAESGSSGAIDLFFEVPDDATAINQIKLAYRNEAPRTYNAATSALTVPSASFGASDGSSLSGSLTTSFNTCGAVIPATGSSERIAVFMTLTRSDSTVLSHDVLYRLEIGGSYYPNSSGTYMIACGGTIPHSQTVLSALNAPTTDTFMKTRTYNTVNAMTSTTVNTDANFVYTTSSVSSTLTALPTSLCTPTNANDCGDDVNTFTSVDVPTIASAGTFTKSTAVTSVSDNTTSVLRSVNTTTTASAVTAYSPSSATISYITYDTVMAYFELPIDLAGNDVQLEVKRSSGGSNFNFVVFYSSFVQGKHTHPIAYDIGFATYTTTDVTLWTTNDSSVASPTWTERTTPIETVKGSALNADEGENELNLVLQPEWFSNSGDLTGWKGVRLQTDGNSRHKMALTLKCFVQSKLSN